MKSDHKLHALKQPPLIISHSAPTEKQSLGMVYLRSMGSGGTAILGAGGSGILTHLSNASAERAVADGSSLFHLPWSLNIQ